jgi:hypothetical protein
VPSVSVASLAALEAAEALPLSAAVLVQAVTRIALAVEVLAVQVPNSSLLADSAVALERPPARAESPEAGERLPALESGLLRPS